MKNSKQNLEDTLIFVDTNVLLDFYRIKKTDISMGYLTQLESCKDKLIIGAQIEMEYKKNRQRVIVEALDNFSTPDWGRLRAPALLADSQSVKMIEKNKKELITQQRKLNQKIQAILRNPTSNDRVYKILQRLFGYKSPYNLSRDRAERFTVRNLAKKRFLLGYPPRKNNDTSIGDAVNWEWILKCSIDSGKHVVIVTRDSDFGVVRDGVSYLNDWLKQEFSQRVSKKRKITLTDKLSQGLKIVNAPVSKAMVEEEERFLEDIKTEFDEPHSGTKSE